MASARSSNKRNFDDSKEANKQLSAKKIKSKPATEALPAPPIKTSPSSLQVKPSGEKDEKQVDVKVVCSAVVQITKKLLGFGAANNWDDIQNSEGRSIAAGQLSRSMYYISKKDKGTGKTTDKTSKTRFFHQPSYEPEDQVKFNDIARRATMAILSHGGGCDEHAYVVAMLLRHLLPPNTIINVCRMKGLNHAFVVIGKIKEETSSQHKENDDLLVVDAWPTQGGVVPLKNYIFREKDLNLQTESILLVDGKDHIIKRIEKQRSALVNSEFTFEPAQLEMSFENRIEEQRDISKFVKPQKADPKTPTFWSCKSVSNTTYQDPPGTQAAYEAILAKFPALKTEIDATAAELNKIGVKKRLGTI